MILAHWHKLKEQQVPRGISLVKTAMAFDTTGANVTITGIQSGDFILWIAASDNGANNWNDNFPNSGTEILGMSGTVDGIAGYFISSGTSYTVQGEGTDFESHGLYHYSVWRNVNPTTPMDGTASFVYHLIGQQPDPPSITTSNDGCVIVSGFMLDDVDGTSATADSSYTLLNKQFAGAGEPTLHVMYKEQTSAGTENPAAFSGVPTSDRKHAFTMALRPA
jgi:hypothetical protein